MLQTRIYIIPAAEKSMLSVSGLRNGPVKIDVAATGWDSDWTMAIYIEEDQCFSSFFDARKAESDYPLQRIRGSLKQRMSC